MELVTLAQATLYRIGSASSFGIVPQQDITFIREVADDNPATLRAFVIDRAVEHGESRDKLEALREEHPVQYEPMPTGTLVFNIHHSNVFYSRPYAMCLAFPALKFGRRYFKLNETHVC